METTARRSTLCSFLDAHGVFFSIVSFIPVGVWIEGLMAAAAQTKALNPIIFFLNRQQLHFIFGEVRDVFEKAPRFEA